MRNYLRFNYRMKSGEQPMCLERRNRRQLLRMSRTERKYYKALKMSGLYPVQSSPYAR